MREGTQERERVRASATESSGGGGARGVVRPPRARVTSSRHGQQRSRRALLAHHSRSRALAEGAARSLTFTRARGEHLALLAHSRLLVIARLRCSLAGGFRVQESKCASEKGGVPLSLRRWSPLHRTPPGPKLGLGRRARRAAVAFVVAIVVVLAGRAACIEVE